MNASTRTIDVETVRRIMAVKSGDIAEHICMQSPDLHDSPVETVAAAFCGMLAESDPAVVAYVPPRVLEAMLQRRIIGLEDVPEWRRTLDACIAAVYADPDAIDAVPGNLTADAAAGAAEMERRDFIAAANDRIPPAVLAAFIAARDAEIIPFAA